MQLKLQADATLKQPTIKRALYYFGRLLEQSPAPRFQTMLLCPTHGCATLHLVRGKCYYPNLREQHREDFTIRPISGIVGVPVTKRNRGIVV